MINNRQAGRRRGRGNTNNGGGGGGQRHGGGGQGGRDTGNRIDSRARGNASQLYEKYKNLARDAQQQGDRVNIEYYLQFADHYFRVLSEQRARLEESQPNHQPQPRRQQPFDLDGDDDYGDEGEPIRAGEQQGQQGQAGYNSQQGGQNGARQDRDDRPQRQDRYEGQRNQRDDRSRDDRPREDRPQRADRAREDRPREDRPREDRIVQNRDPRDDQQDADQNGTSQGRDRQPRGEYRDAPPPRDAGRRTPRTAVTGDMPAADAAEQQALTPVVETPIVESTPQQSDAVATTEEQPRRRGRPRRDRSADEAVAMPPALDADRLPPSLGIGQTMSASTAPAAVEGTEEKPRRRRVRAVAPETTDAG